jgi:hypothetical protein
VTGRRSLIAALTTLTLFAAACGVSTGDDSFTVIAPEEDPFGLDATSTTTSTTTTTTTTLPVTPDTVATTTTTPIRTEPAEIYFLTTRGRLLPVFFELPPPLAAEQVADVLEAGPPPDQPLLDTLIEEGLIVSSSENRAVLTVDLDPATFARIPSTEQTEAIGQIVMTMISSLRRVGFVNFTIEGEPISVKKGNSLLSDVGEPLAYDDYTNLLATPPPAVASTTEPPAETVEPPVTSLPDP